MPGRIEMSGRIPIRLEPLGASIEVDRGASLHSVLFPLGVEFPCGGAGACRGCRVRVLAGSLAVTSEMRDVLAPAELAAGWRLACCAVAEEPLTLEIGQWATPILTDDAVLPVEPAEGCAIAIDLGTTTLVAQAVDLATGSVLAVETALNPQAIHGSDVMSRIEFALSGGAAALTALIRAELGRMISALPRRESVRRVLVAGNTVMHHLFCGLDVEPLSHVPFHASQTSGQRFPPEALGWDLPANAEILFLPCLGSFVGSDVLAGIVATGMAERREFAALLDLGTNGEIVVGNCDRLLCASTAAGPAFEAGRIRAGMRATSGAISRVQLSRGALECSVIGGVQPRGICGSGLVDAVAAGLELGAILPSGRLASGGTEFPLTREVSLFRADIRELQLAKGAIAAGLRLLVARCGRSMADLQTVWLAGAFGNYVSIRSARGIGLLDAALARVEPSGNTSLRGLRKLLLAPSIAASSMDGVLAHTEHLALAADPAFQDTYVDCMALKPS
jgi:uncharacterized 2Fe-2S/4Fe-4S cluster protein (DUF4445 family)